MAQVSHLPTLTVQLTDPTIIRAYETILKQLEDHDGLKEVYSTAELPEH